MAYEVVHVRPGIEPKHAALAALLGIRVKEFADTHEYACDGLTFMRQAMVQVWQDDPNSCLVGIVGDEGEVVGHALAWYHGSVTPEYRTLFIAQAKADGNVGDAMKRVFRYLEAWGRALGATQARMTTHRSPDAWARHGFTETHHLMHKRFSEEVGEAGAPGRVRQQE